MRKDIEAFKTAQRELEAEAAPILSFDCVEPDPLPISIQAEDQARVKCAISLQNGQMAEDISIFIYAPPGFDFPDLSQGAKWVLADKDIFPGYLMRMQDCSRLIKGLRQFIYFTIQAPSEIGAFEIKYDVNCRGLERLTGKIDVEVIPKSQPRPKISKPKG